MLLLTMCNSFTKKCWGNNSENYRIIHIIALSGIIMESMIAENKMVLFIKDTLSMTQLIMYNGLCQILW